MQFGPALRAAAGIAVLSIMDAVIKGMSAYYPTFQVAFLRFACGSLVVAGVVAVMRPGWPSRETVTANSLRSVIAVVTAVSFFYALGQLPLAETLVLSFLSPMFIALFGHADAAGAGGCPDHRRHRHRVRRNAGRRARPDGGSRRGPVLDRGRRSAAHRR